MNFSKQPTIFERGLIQALGEKDIEVSKRKFSYEKNGRSNEFEPDIVIESAKIVIEVDGGHHHGDAGQKIADELRDKRMEESGYEVIRVSNKELMDLKKFTRFVSAVEAKVLHKCKTLPSKQEKTDEPTLDVGEKIDFSCCFCEEKISLLSKHYGQFFEPQTSWGLITRKSRDGRMWSYLLGFVCDGCAKKIFENLVHNKKQIFSFNDCSICGKQYLNIHFACFNNTKKPFLMRASTEKLFRLKGNTTHLYPSSESRGKFCIVCPDCLEEAYVVITSKYKLNNKHFKVLINEREESLFSEQDVGGY